MTKVGIILGSVRPGRVGSSVAEWVHNLAAQRGDAEYELIDILNYDLGHLDEPHHPALGNYAHDHTKRWAAKVDSLDAIVFVTPEYNRSISGALKDAIDFLYAEWNNKPVGFVSYGIDGGVRAVEHLRQILAAVSAITVAPQVSLSIYSDFENGTKFTPAEVHEGKLKFVLDQVLSWTDATRALRPSRD